VLHDLEVGDAARVSPGCDDRRSCAAGLDGEAEGDTLRPLRFGLQGGFCPLVGRDRDLAVRFRP